MSGTLEGPARRPPLQWYCGRRVAALIALELRTARRARRSWSLLLFATSVAGGVYALATHDFIERFSPSLGIYGPRYLVAAFGTHYLGLLIFVLAFMAFDGADRDRRDGIEEAFDVRPASNLEILGARCIGLTLAVWIPAVLVGLAMQAFGSAVEALGWPFGGQMEPFSLLAFLIWGLLPSLMLWCAAILLLANILPNRAAVLAVVLGLLAFWWYFVPGSASLALGVVANHGIVHVSDMLPSFGVVEGLIGRLGVLLLAAALIVMASAAAPRRDADRRRTVVAALVLAALGFGTATGVAWGEALRSVEVRNWANVHGERANTTTGSATGTPYCECYDILSNASRVVIWPTEDMELVARLEVSPEDDTRRPLAFTLNPGLHVKEVNVDGDSVVFTHRHGLLSIVPPKDSRKGTLTVTVAANGVPRSDFAYFGAEAQVGHLANGQSLLGSEAVVFESRYVALMPAAHWLPHLGPATRNLQRPRRKDYFRLALEVHVPSGWSVAAPGRRVALGGDGDHSRFQFKPKVPVAEVPLFASRFASRSDTVAGVELELLFSERHGRNVDLFADVQQSVLSTVKEHLTAGHPGVAYPFDGLQVVEVPVALRSYGDDLQMGSSYGLPGVLLVRESGFPTAPFPRRLAHLFASHTPPLDEARQAEKVAEIQHYFEGDVTGGNPLHGLHRNLLPLHVGFYGEGAEAVRYVVEELMNLTLAYRRDWFSAKTPPATIVRTLTSLLAARVDALEITLPLLDVFVGGSGGGAVHPDTERSLASLGDDPAHQSLDIVTLHQRGRAVARTVFDDLGVERTERLLGEIRSVGLGRDFTATDFEALANRHLSSNLDSMTSGWIHGKALPGFQVSMPTIRPLVRADDDGRRRYVVNMHIHNGEPVTGSLRIAYADGGRGRAFSDVITLAAHNSVELGLATRLPTIFGRVEPYLARNEESFPLPELSVDDEAAPVGEGVLGIRASDWQPAPINGVVVDDLDAGFSVEQAWNEPAGWSLRRLLPISKPESGGPYAVYSTEPPRRWWSRRPLGTAWGGGYRRSLVDIRSGFGNAKATFRAQLPTVGRWRLEYHMPRLVSKERSRYSPDFGSREGQGRYHLVVQTADTTTLKAQHVEFDAATSIAGWNSIGEFDLDAKAVTVAVSNKTSGELVYADAVRWTEVETLAANASPETPL